MKDALTVLILTGSLLAGPRGLAAELSDDGTRVSLKASNESYGQILELFQQKSGLQFEIPAELRGENVPLLEVDGLTLKGALMKLMEGSNYDYILLGSPANMGRIERIIITGKSVKVTAVAGGAIRPSPPPPPQYDDPFAGGADMQFEQPAVPEQAVQPINVTPQSAVPGTPQPAVPQGYTGQQPPPGSFFPPFQTAPGQIQPIQPQAVQPQPQVLQPIGPGSTPANPYEQRRNPF